MACCNLYFLCLRDCVCIVCYLFSMHMTLNANPERASVWSWRTSSSLSQVSAGLSGSPRSPLCETLVSQSSFQAHRCLSSFLLSAFSHSLPLQIHGLHEEHSSWSVTESLLAENSVFSRKVCFLCPKIALLEILLLSFFMYPMLALSFLPLLLKHCS